MSLPQCEDVRSRGYEILYLTAPIDEMVLQQIRMVDGKPFINIVTDDLGFQTEEEKKAAAEKSEEEKELLDFMRDSIGDENLKQVVFSSKLVSSACCLTTTGGVTLEMEKYFRVSPSEEMRKIRANRVLEVNPSHRAFRAVKMAYDSLEKDKAAKLSKILYAQAQLIAGLELEDPAAYSDMVTSLF